MEDSSPAAEAKGIVMITSFASDSANGVWQQAAQIFRSGGGFRSHSSRSGPTSELLHATFSIADPRQRWVTNRSPALNPAFAIAEVVWIIKGRQDEPFLTYWNKQMIKFSGEGPNFHGAYGHRLRKNYGVDQVERAYQILKTNPNTRQLVLQIWDPTKDLPNEEGAPRAEDIPCNIASLVKVREGRLEWMQVLRSNDFFLGIPHNFVQFTYLQEILAGWLGVEVGSYNQISDSLHIYDRDIEKVKTSFPFVVEKNCDNLALPKAISEACFDELEHRIEAFISDDLSETDHERLLKWSNAPEGFRNMLSILAGEAARRRGWDRLVNESAAMLTNPALIQLWNRWIERMS